MNKNQINIDSLITINFDFKDASSAYQLLKTDRSATGLILNFNSENIKKENNYSINYINSEDKTKKSTGLKVGFIGAGNYAASKLLPAFSKTGANMFSISSQSALKPYHLARKYKFKNLTTDIDQILKNDDIKVVVISTKHDSHAEYIKKAYENNKHVFVEKPICVNNEELSALKDLYLNSKNKNILKVGFNRRFSKLITNIKENLDNNKTPKSFIYNINSSKLPNNHWINKREQGGRLIGEACHFIDLLRYLSGSKINNKNIYRISDEDFIISLKFCNGDIATVNYNCGGTKSFPKERLEIFGGGEIITLDNFKKIKYWNNPLRNRERFFTQDKGHSNCAKAFIDCVENFKTAPIPLDEIFEVQSVLLELTQS